CSSDLTEKVLTTYSCARAGHRSATVCRQNLRRAPVLRGSCLRWSEAAASYRQCNRLQRDLASYAGTSASGSFQDPQCRLEACLAQAGRCESNSPTAGPDTPPEATRL